MDFHILVATNMPEPPRKMDGRAEDRYYREKSGISMPFATVAAAVSRVVSSVLDGLLAGGHRGRAS